MMPFIYYILQLKKNKLSVMKTFFLVKKILTNLRSKKVPFFQDIFSKGLPLNI